MAIKKKTMKKLICVMLEALLILMLGACSCAKPQAEIGPEKVADQIQEKQNADIVGRYEITAVVTEGKETADEDLALLKDRGLNCTLDLNPDGTGTLDLFGEERDLTWDNETISTAEKTMPYTIQENQLILTDGDSSLTFSQTD